MRFLVVAVLAFSSSLYAAQSDLSVGWIARNPKIDYVWNSSNPTVEGWPAEGSTVRWVANVRWLGSEVRRGVAYRWLIDGNVARSGTLDFDPESLVQTELPWTWTFARHEIAFEIDTDARVGETNERNNRLRIDSNAIALGLYVERTYWNSISPRLQEANIGVTTFDDWMQRLVRRFNEMARYAIYPDTPDGVLDRWRIDEIHLVEDSTLPLAPPYTEARDWGAAPVAQSSLYPNVLDHTVDIQWGFPAFAVAYWPEATPWIFMIGNSTVHEFGHARTMIDSYAWSLSADQDAIEIQPAPPADSRSKFVYSSHDHGMMHFDWGHIDRYTAAAMNLMTGRRALRGNYNEPWDLGWFLDDIPAMNRVRLIRTDNTAIANRDVFVYRAEPLPNARFYEMLFDNTPELSLRTDNDGVVVLPRSVFPEHITCFIDRSNGTSIVRIEDGSTTRWAFLESLDFNMAYWRGNREVAEYTVMADAPLCTDQLGPSAVLPLPEAVVTTREVQFQFPGVANHHYELFYAVDGADPVSITLQPSPNAKVKMTLEIPAGRIVWWFLDHDSPLACPPQHSSMYTFDHVVQTAPRRRAVR